MSGRISDKGSSKNASGSGSEKGALIDKPDDVPKAAEGGGKSAVAVPQLLAVRIVILLILFLVAHFWLQHHFGVSLWQTLTGGVVASIGLGVIKFIWEGFFGKEDERWKMPLYKLAVFSVQVPVLLAFLIVVVIAFAFVSTVHVVTDGATGPRKMRLWSGTPSDEANQSVTRATLDDGTSVKIFPRLTHPFGRWMTLDVDGYYPEEFRVWPLAASRIRLNELDPVISLLVRVPIGLLGVSDMSSVSLYREGDDTPMAVVNLKEGIGSALFRHHAVKIDTSRFHETWHDEAISEGADDAAAARMKLQWNKWVLVDLSSEVKKNMGMVAELKTRKGETIASKPFTVSGKPLQDILMEEK